jgi:ParB-like chromosome segregation protein Spo0J
MKSEELKPSGKVHPVAAMFPMLNDEDLEALAASIAKEGLTDAIVLDENGDLIDGRNREAACKKRGIKPRYVLLNGDDPVAYIFRKNSIRRHMAKGQRAMVAVKAELMRWQAEQAEKGLQSFVTNDSDFIKYGRRKVLAAMAGVSEELITKAKQVTLYANELVDVVIAGGGKDKIALDEAYKEAQEREADLNSTENQKKRLRSVAPDLADVVDEERMTLPEARAALEKRIETEKKNRVSTTSQVSQCIGILNPRAYTVEQHVEELIKWFDPKLATEEITPEILNNCTAVFRGLVNKLKTKE